MSKVLVFIFFSFVFLILGSCEVLAVSPGKIGIASSRNIWLEGGGSGGIKATITISGKDLNGKPVTYVKSYTRMGNCPTVNMPCLSGVELPDGNDDNGNPPPALNGIEKYKVSIAASYLSSGGTVMNTKVSCYDGRLFGILGTRPNCGPWDLKLGEDTGQIVFYVDNQGTTNLTPVVKPSTTSMTRSDSLSVEVLNLDNPDIDYVVFIENNTPQRPNGSFIKQSIFKINKTRDGCTFAKNELQISCQNQSPNVVKGTFTLKGSFFPEIGVDESYGIHAIGSGATKEGTASVLVKSSNPTKQSLSVSILPKSTITTSEVVTLTFRVTPTEVGKKYNIKIGGATPGDIKELTGQPGSTDYYYPTGSGKTSYFTGPGEYIVTVLQKDDPSKFGTATLTVTGGSAAGGSSSGAVASTCTPGDPDCATAAGIKCDTTTGQDILTGDGIKTAIGCIPTEPKAFIQKTMGMLFGVLGGIALLLMIAGSFKVITAAGNPDNLKAGREQFTAAIIGLVFVIFAVLIMRVIGVQILDIIPK